MRLLTVNDSKAINKSIVSELSAKLRKIGCIGVFLTMDAKSWCVARCLLHVSISFVL